MRSGTSRDESVRESEYVVSKVDFINNRFIALKEANETENSVGLLHRLKTIDKRLLISLQNDSKQILRVLISIIKSS